MSHFHCVLTLYSLNYRIECIRISLYVDKKGIDGCKEERQEGRRNTHIQNEESISKKLLQFVLSIIFV